MKANSSTGFQNIDSTKQSFQNKTGKRKGDPKGVDKTHRSY